MKLAIGAVPSLCTVFIRSAKGMARHFLPLYSAATPALPLYGSLDIVLWETL